MVGNIEQKTRKNCSKMRKTGEGMSSTADEVSVAAHYMNVSLMYEAAVAGSMQRAEENFGRKYGLSVATMRRIRGGKAKDIRLGLFHTIRRAYLDYCEKQVRTLRHEIHIQQARYEDASLAHLENEVAALAEKVAAAKERART